MELFVERRPYLKRRGVEGRTEVETTYNVGGAQNMRDEHRQERFLLRGISSIETMHGETGSQEKGN